MADNDMCPLDKPPWFTSLRALSKRGSSPALQFSDSDNTANANPEEGRGTGSKSQGIVSFLQNKAKWWNKQKAS